MTFFNNLGEIINQVFGSAENRIPLSEYTGWHFVVMVFFGMLTVAALVLATILTGLLYCICWIIAFIDDFINNEWKDKND